MTRKRDVTLYPAARAGAHKIYSFMELYSARLKHKSRAGFEASIFWYAVGAVYFPKAISPDTLVPNEVRAIEFDYPEADLGLTDFDMPIDDMIAET
jgi:hypothetical protein